MRHRFQKANRICKARVFQKLLNEPKFRISEKAIVLLAAPNERLEASIGIIVAKRHFKKACSRNKIKRLFRESFRMNLLTLPSYDIVLIARPTISQLSNESIFKALQHLWNRLKKTSQPL